MWWPRSAFTIIVLKSIIEESASINQKTAGPLYEGEWPEGIFAKQSFHIDYKIQSFPLSNCKTVVRPNLFYERQKNWYNPSRQAKTNLLTT